jgi:ATP/maltotriose-dependent transcriptional regulator MalT
MGRFDAAATVAAAAEAEVSQPLARAEIAARRAGLLLETEGPAAAAEAARALIGGTHPASLGGSVVAGLALVRLGRLDDAAAACAAGRAATAPDRASPDWWPPALLELARAEALAQSGALAAAEALAADEHRRAVAVGVLDVQAFAAWQLARVLLLRGRVTAAVRHGREAAALLRQLGRPLLWQHSLVTLVTAEALRGRPGAALEILAEVDASGLPPSHGSSVDLLAGRAWASVAGGDLSAARQHLAEAADLAVAIGDRVGEASALHDQARLGGAPAVADRLAQVVAGIDGALAPARLEHTQALARGDGDRLLTVSDALEALGAWLLAAEAASDAAVALRRDREPRRAAAAQRRAAELGGRCEGVTTPALRAVESRALLTQAERDVASLAAAGRSNREIATALYLSLRTVENRLYRIYEKLGISGRSELADAWEGS